MAVTMSNELHVIVGGHPSMTAKEALAIFRKRNPKFKVNENSFNVAFSNARKKLGYRKSRKGSAKPKTMKVTNNLHAAADFVKQIGGISEAIEAIKHLERLQLS